MKNRALTILTVCLVVLLHVAAGYGLRQIKGHNKPHKPVHVVQAALLPVAAPVAAATTIAAKPLPPAVKKVVQKPKKKPKPRKKKRSKAVRRTAVPKQPPPPKPPAAPQPEPLLLASVAQHIPAPSVYEPPQQPVVVVSSTPAPFVPAEQTTTTAERDIATPSSTNAANSSEANHTQQAAVTAPQVITSSISQADYLSNPKPQYPPISRRLGEQGVVRLEVLVSVLGKAQRVRVLKSSGYERLDRLAQSTVQRSWRFTPKRVDGQAVAQRVHFNMPFVLN